MELDFGFELKELSEKGSFMGLASTYNVDEVGEQVERGAFTNTLREQGAQRPLLWHHDPANPIGLADLRDSKEGLIVHGTLDLDVTVGKDAYSRIRKGITKGLSIGFKTLKDEVVGKVRVLKEIALYEVSLVSFPANRQAVVSAVKSQIGTIRAYEDFLHRSGWSKAEACRLAGHGWPALAVPDDSEGQAQLLDWLRSENARAA